MPQPPQLRLSQQFLTQPPAQTVCPGAQPTAQLPSAQTLEGGHGSPQAPQLAALVWVSTQKPAHAVVPVAQPHTPEMQEAPPVQALPHAPQLLGLVWVSTQ